MTEWSDAEISRRLALAIGWKEEQMEESANGNGVLLPGSDGEMWRFFDYRDPAVYAPIAERFDCFPSKVACGDTTGWLVLPGVASDIQPTAAKAVALAVIKAKEQT